jgi:hypothetical protein
MPPEADVGSDESPIEPKARQISNKPPRKSTNRLSSQKDISNATAPKTEVAPKLDQKRSNRRRRGKGKSNQKESDYSSVHETPSVEETIHLVPETPQAPSARKEKPDARREKSQENHPQPQKPRRKLDPEKVAKNAWKIFLAEVSEEGVALIGDNDARELARRSFRLSEIFMEEADKRA